MKKFFIVEDTGDIATILTSYLIMFLPSDYEIITVHNCKDIKNAQYNDIILCDQMGVNIELLKNNGADIITMSGDTDLNVDLYKPFTSIELRNKVLSTINKQKTIQKNVA